MYCIGVFFLPQERVPKAGLCHLFILIILKMKCSVSFNIFQIWIRKFSYELRCLFSVWFPLPASMAAAEREFHEQQIVFCVWRGGQDWAASPDMSPMDFFLWPYMKVWPVHSISDVPPDQGWHGYILSARRIMSYEFTMGTHTNPHLILSDFFANFG